MAISVDGKISLYLQKVAEDRSEWSDCERKMHWIEEQRTSAKKLASEKPSPWRTVIQESGRLKLGTVLDGGYVISKALAEAGGSFNVGISLVEKDGKKYLCKSVPEGYSDREVRLLKRVSHPNTTKIVHHSKAEPGWKCEHFEQACYEVDCPGDEVDRIMMEYCNQGTLLDMITRYSSCNEHIPEALILHVFESLAKALHCCHTGEGGNSIPNNGEVWDAVMHRDVIPSNVFLTVSDQSEPYPRIVLGDFGCAMEQSRYNELQSGNMGPLALDNAFLTPERPLIHDIRSDVYQLGLIIWCLAYRTVIPGYSTFLAVHTDEFELGLWPYSSRLADLMALCLSWNPNNRPSSGELTIKVQQIQKEIVVPAP
ncbi:kinase-like protein [Corynespora cassiicola Philippines]|uniref:non-specific serine/threonine protein kinase n=1 Tax=Corynespora cassiicola Philippines TaxID=1448308 RepID=A0A2T2NRT0_CORCC|nr:kinase-like protein [Corynespora cassiicola Philippines]